MKNNAVDSLPYVPTPITSRKAEIGVFVRPPLTH